MGVLIGAVASWGVGYVLLKRFPVKEEEAEIEEHAVSVPGLS